MTETHNPLVGASMWERDLYEHLSTHADTERVLLEEYTAAAKKTESKALEYLVNLLIEDEIRHHRYFEQLAESLKASAELRSDDLPVPMVDFHQVDASAVFEVSDRLLKKEREDAQELKRLQRELHRHLGVRGEARPLNHRVHPVRWHVRADTPQLTVDGERSQGFEVDELACSMTSSDPPPARLPQRSASAACWSTALHGSRQCIARSFSE
jgi:hypothetical protein